MNGTQEAVEQAQGSPAPSRKRRRWAVVAVLLLIAVGIAAALNRTSAEEPSAARSATVPSATPSEDAARAEESTRESTPAAVANPYDGLDPAALADAELALAQSGGSCSDLRLWYAANPGDSNLQIAQHFYRQCGSTPPPVTSGELSMSDVTGAGGQASTGQSGQAQFLVRARGLSGSGWPFLTDSQLVALGTQMCPLLRQGVSAQTLVDTLDESGTGASRSELVSLVNASTGLC